VCIPVTWVTFPTGAHQPDLLFELIQTLRCSRRVKLTIWACPVAVIALHAVGPLRRNQPRRSNVITPRFRPACRVAQIARSRGAARACRSGSWYLLITWRRPRRDNCCALVQQTCARRPPTAGLGHKPSFLWYL